MHFFLFLLSILPFSIIHITESNDAKRLVEQAIQSAAKIIEIKFYSTIDYEGEKVISEEYTDYEHIPSISYYDAYNREILCKDYHYTLTSYFAKENKDRATSIIEYSSDLETQERKLSFIRDNIGKLIQTVEVRYGEERMRTHYNSQGSVEKIIQGSKTKYYTDLPSDSGISIRSYKVIDTNNNDIVNGTVGLVEKGTLIYRDKKLVHSEIYNYEYGRVQSIKKEDYQRDENGRVIKINREEHNRLMAIPMSENLKPGTDEYREYIISKVYTTVNPQRIFKYSQSIDYDDFGSRICEIREQYGDSDSLLRKELITYNYKYNEHGDWVKCTESKYYEHDGEFKPYSTIIVIRTITYKQ